MNKLRSIVALLAFVSIGLQSCKKESPAGIDNDRVIVTPFSLYAANDKGWIINSNDGRNYKSVFPPDGMAPQLFAFAGDNLLMLKNSTLYLSENDGKNFDRILPAVPMIIHPYSSTLLSSVSHKRVYVTVMEGFGVGYSEDNGKSWMVDDNLQDEEPPQVMMNTFVEVSNGTIYALTESIELYKKANVGSRWEKIEMDEESTLPAAYLSTDGTNLYATNYDGTSKIWESKDGGTVWREMEEGELPVDEGKIFHSTICPGNGVVIVATEDGIYRSQYNEGFKLSNSGLEKGIKINSLTVKRNYYKDGSAKAYVFAGTNSGIYVSENDGLTWDLTTDDMATIGDFKVVY